MASNRQHRYVTLLYTLEFSTHTSRISHHFVTAGWELLEEAAAETFKLSPMRSQLQDRVESKTEEWVSG
jgi:hypothetical protein